MLVDRFPILTCRHNSFFLDHLLVVIISEK